MSLLAGHGLTGLTEEPLQHSGFSGATLSRMERNDGARFILKRMSIERDWIMRATRDEHCREAALAHARVDLPSGVATPSIGAARDGSEYALLMHDIGAQLLPQDRVDDASVRRIIGAMAALHRVPVPRDQTPWCDVRDRLMLLTPTTAGIAAAHGAAVAADITNGWRIFDDLASPRTAALIRRLFDDPSRLLEALAQSPPALLHGDLKFDNIGIDTEGNVLLIDWAMTLIAPPAVELGWFLAINSRRMSLALDDVMAAYATAAGLTGDAGERHGALTVLCGLLLRGWRKALDADHGEPEQLKWWCDGAEGAEDFLVA